MFTNDENIYKLLFIFHIFRGIILKIYFIFPERILHNGNH